MKFIENMSDGEIAAAIVFGILGAFLGIAVGWVSHAIRAWWRGHQDKKADKYVGNWISRHSIGQLAEACEQGKVSLAYPTRRLVTKIANAIEIGDDVDGETRDVDMENSSLMADLMTIGTLRPGEEC